MRSYMRSALLCAGACFLALMTVDAGLATPVGADGASDTSDSIQELKALIASQQKQIEELRSTLSRQQVMLEKLTTDQNGTDHSVSYSLPNAKKLGEVAST